MPGLLNDYIKIQIDKYKILCFLKKLASPVCFALSKILLMFDKKLYKVNSYHILVYSIILFCGKEWHWLFVLDLEHPLFKRQIQNIYRISFKMLFDMLVGPFPLLGFLVPNMCAISLDATGVGRNNSLFVCPKNEKQEVLVLITRIL